MTTFDVKPWLKTWYRNDVFTKDCVKLAKFFGEVDGKPKEKDLRRAYDIVNKSTISGELNKEIFMRHVNNMANKITKPDKAFRRALAFVLVSSLKSPGKVFISRCWDILKEYDKCG